MCLLYHKTDRTIYSFAIMKSHPIYLYTCIDCGKTWAASTRFISPRVSIDATHIRPPHQALLGAEHAYLKWYNSLSLFSKLIHILYISIG